MVDSRMKAQKFDFTEHEWVRSAFQWGSYGKDNNESLNINILENLSTNHIYNILRTQKLEVGIHNMFVLELCYRIDILEQRG